MANNEPMTTERRASIKARCDAATPGPWKTGKDDFTKNIIEAAKDRGTIIVQRRDDYNMHWNSLIPIEQTFADAAFIAHARQDIPDLLAEVERWQRVTRYLAKKLTHDDGSENSGFPSGKWQGATHGDCCSLYRTREDAVQSWIDEAEREVGNERD